MGEGGVSGLRRIFQGGLRGEGFTEELSIFKVNGVMLMILFYGSRMRPTPTIKSFSS